MKNKQTLRTQNLQLLIPYFVVYLRKNEQYTHKMQMLIFP